MLFILLVGSATVTVEASAVLVSLLGQVIVSVGLLILLLLLCILFLLLDKGPVWALLGLFGKGCRLEVQILVSIFPIIGVNLMLQLLFPQVYLVLHHQRVLRPLLLFL
jgi:hypothetical protein